MRRRLVAARFFTIVHLSMTCPTPLHAGKGGDRLGIYFIVEVMTLPLGLIYWVNPHIYFVRAEEKRNIREIRIYLSLKCSPHSKKRLISTQLAQSSLSQASFNINSMYFIIIVPAVHSRCAGPIPCMRNDLPLGKVKSPLVWAIISGKTPRVSRMGGSGASH